MDAIRMISSYIQNGYSIFSNGNNNKQGTWSWGEYGAPVTASDSSCSSSDWWSQHGLLGGAAKFFADVTARAKNLARLPSNLEDMITLDDNFASRLLDIGLNFITKLISSRVSVLTKDNSAQLALTYLQPNHV